MVMAKNGTLLRTQSRSVGGVTTHLGPLPVPVFPDQIALIDTACSLSRGSILHTCPFLIFQSTANRC